MTTYTIAMIDDMLAATAVDGDTKMMDDRLEDTLSQINSEDREASEDRVCYISGLTLFASEDEADEAGAEVIYSGCDTGWLQDADGEMKYQVAGRVQV